MAKFQLCSFKRKKMGEWERGLALLNGGFGVSDVNVILDAKGKPLDEHPFQYRW